MSNKGEFPETKNLSHTKSGGNGLEIAYAEWYKDIPMKRKYRVGKHYSGGGNHSDNKGVARHKMTDKNTPPPQHKTLCVDGLTGKARFR